MRPIVYNFFFLLYYELYLIDTINIINRFCLYLHSLHSITFLQSLGTLRSGVCNQSFNLPNSRETKHTTADFV